MQLKTLKRESKMVVSLTIFRGNLWETSQIENHDEQKKIVIEETIVPLLPLPPFDPAKDLLEVKVSIIRQMTPISGSVESLPTQAL